MNRQIKFRCWDSYYKRYMQWEELRGYSTEDIFTEDDELSFYGGLQQFTGLKDKNGKEIYEGDIVNAWSQGVNAKCVVKWGKGTARFFLYRKTGGIVWNLSGGSPDYSQETVEIIGNVFETPHLLAEPDTPN